MSYSGLEYDPCRCSLGFYCGCEDKPKRTCRACFFDHLDDHTCGYKGKAEDVSGCEYHLGQFDRTCCNGRPPEKLDGYYTMTNYFQQAAVAEDIMNSWLEDNSESKEEWEAWDWL